MSTLRREMEDGEDMNILEPGHIYDLKWYDGKSYRPFETLLIFMKREGQKYPGNIGSHPGTNIQEVLRALIDRVKYLDEQISDSRNGQVLLHLRAAIILLEDRAADRHGRALPWRPGPAPLMIEYQATCRFCGHIGCGETCR